MIGKVVKLIAFAMVASGATSMEIYTETLGICNVDLIGFFNWGIS